MTVTVTVVLKYNRSSYRNISLFSTTVAAMPKCSSVNNEHKNILLDYQPSIFKHLVIFLVKMYETTTIDKIMSNISIVIASWQLEN